MRYPGSVPLYPPADRYVEAFGEAQLRHWLSRRNIGGLLMPLCVSYQTLADEYTPNAVAASSAFVRNSRVSDDFLTKEWRLVIALLPAKDQVTFESACRQEPAGGWKGDVIGLGPGAFGRVGPACYQNYARAADYCAALDQDRLPVWRGLVRTPDDLARGAVIEALAVYRRVSLESIEIAHVIDFHQYFAAEMADLRALEREGLLALSPEWILATDAGCARMREICTVFDRYRRAECERATLPRVL